MEIRKGIMFMKKKPNENHGYGQVSMILAAIVMTFAFCGHGKNMFDWRLVMLPSLPIKSEIQMDTVNMLLETMQDHDYNGIYIDGAWMINLTKAAVIKSKPSVDAFMAEAKKRGIAVIPMSQGQAGNLQMDQNLRETFQVKGTPFQVLGGIATVIEDSSPTFVNGDFEQPLGTANWSKYGSFKVVAGGRPGSTGSTCLMLDNPTTDGLSVIQKLTVKRYRTYELSVWARIRVDKLLGTKEGNAGEDVQFVVRGTNPALLLKDRDWHGIPSNNKWKRFSQIFNSLDNTVVTIHLHGTDYWRFEGAVWFDDASIREVGLREVSNHPYAKVTVKTAGGKILSEGTDFIVGNGKLTIPVTSAAKEGEVLSVDWVSQANVTHGFAEAAFCYDEVWQGMRQQIALEDQWFGVSPAKLMKYSEWRLAGWDFSCISQYNINELGCGPYMAGAANKTAQLYREANSNRIAMIWHDNYTPYHNTGKPVGVINGGNLGGGHLLDTSIVIVNWAWSGDMGKKTMMYFAGLDSSAKATYPQFGGRKTTRHRQILSCNGPGAWSTALKNLNDCEMQGLRDGNIIGIGYQMFGRVPSLFLSKVEPLAQACIAAGRWGKGPIDFPPASVNPVAKPAGSATQFSASAARHGRCFFRFSVPKNQNVNLSVYDLQGKRIATLLREQMAAGTYQRNLNVSEFASGVYFARLEVAGESVQRVTRKMVLF